ncbi:MAG TPA: phosphoribosylanthranilate isomerase [Gemmatimonadales bacterium]|nr:phosphoribosylanthranilate isomerase [Gemmatimonadales bacterium]
MIQVAGIRDWAEAELLQECGVRYLGFPLRLEVHQEDLSEVAAADIIRRLRPPTRGVLITYINEAEAIAEFCQAMGARTVQLHGDVSRTELERLRELDPTLTIIKSLVVGRHPSVLLERLAVELAPLVDGFITDTYVAETGASGATGRTHDWTVSHRLAMLSPKPVILAGGLTPSNVRQAIAAVRPSGVDVHTGVEDATGRKDREKVLTFVAEAKAGFVVTGSGPAAERSL